MLAAIAHLHTAKVAIWKFKLFHPSHDGKVRVEVFPFTKAGHADAKPCNGFGTLP